MYVGYAAALADLEVAQASHNGREGFFVVKTARPRGDRLAVRAGTGMAEERTYAVGHLLAEDVLEAAGRTFRFRCPQVEDVGEEPFCEAMPARYLLSELLAFRGEGDAVTFHFDEP